MKGVDTYKPSEHNKRGALNLPTRKVELLSVGGEVIFQKGVDWFFY